MKNFFLNIFLILFFTEVSIFGSLAQEKNLKKNNKLKNENKQKVNKKQLYSYTWNTEKKKIFEKKEYLPYGTSTTKYITLNDLKNNAFLKYNDIYDLNFLTIHRYTLIEFYNYKIQNLGIDCSPSRHIFFDSPYVHIGRTSGVDLFSIYYGNINELKIFNTKSPYTYIFIIPGRKISKLNFEYSQNILPNWNIGLTIENSSLGIPYEKYPLFKQNLLRLISLHSYYHYNNKYHLALALKHMKAYWRELIPMGKDDTELLSFKKDEEKIPYYPYIFKNINLEYPNNDKPLFIENQNWIDFTKNVNFRWQLNLYEQYDFSDLFQIYHDFNYYYTNDSLGVRDADELESDHPKLCGLRSISLYNFTNEVGSKGLFSESIFYKLYYKNNLINRVYNHLKVEKNNNSKLFEIENYIGFKSLLLVSEENIAGIEGEYLFPKFYKIGTFYNNRLFSLSAQHYKKKTPFLFDKYWGYDLEKPVQSQVHEKKLDYDYPLITQFKGLINILNMNFLKAKPTALALLIGKEYSNLDIFICPGAIINLSYENIHWDNETIISFAVTENPAYNLPLIFVNSKIYYQALFYNEKLRVATGFDIHFKSKYNASSYDNKNHIFKPKEAYPQQVWGYPLVNYYINIFYNNLCIFLKITHINQGILSPGYFTTNKYPSQRRSFDLGISYKFFD